MGCTFSNKTENPFSLQDDEKIGKTLGDSQRLYKNLKDSPRTLKTLKDSQILSKTLKDSQRLSKTLKDSHRTSQTLKDFQRLTRDCTTSMLTILTDLHTLKVEKTDNKQQQTKTILRDDEYSLRYSSSKNFFNSKNKEYNMKLKLKKNLI